MIKIVTVNFNDTSGGAARAAYRLHKGLIDHDIDSKMLVQRKYSNDPSVDVYYGNSKTGLAYSFFRSTVDGLVNKLQYSTNSIIHNANWLPSSLHKRINKSNADIVHLHWIGKGMISISEIAKIEKPIVWTLHDMWAFCGAEHYDDLDFPKRYAEGYYKRNRPDAYKGIDIDRWTWKRKMKHWSDKELNIVTPSKWLANCARESTLLKNKNIQVIPNGLDLDLYKPIPKEWARKIMNIPEEKSNKYILFGAMSATSDRRKGFKQLQKALSRLKNENYRLLVFGSEGYEDIDFNLPTTYLGKLNDDEILALAYSSADTMVVPSLQDNLPNTAVEAVACGTPVVGFNIGGLSDIIDHQKNGYLAEPFSSKDLANGIIWNLKNHDHNKEISKKARKKAVDKFSLDKIAKQYLELYEQIL